MKEEALLPFFVEPMLKQHEVFVNQVTNRYLALQKSDLFCRALLLLFLEVLGIRRLRTTSVQESLSCGLEQTSNKFAAETCAWTDVFNLFQHTPGYRSWDQEQDQRVNS